MLLLLDRLHFIHVPVGYIDELLSGAPNGGVVFREPVAEFDPVRFY